VRNVRRSEGSRRRFGRWLGTAAALGLLAAVFLAAGSPVASGAAADHLVLTVSTSTPTSGTGNDLTITAEDPSNATDTTYIGDHNLTFGGASDAATGEHPTVTDTTGAAINFGTATTITFINGVATVSGPANGVMKLYKAEAASITVTDGTIDNGSGTAVTVAPAVVDHFVLGAPSPSGKAGQQSSVSVAAFDQYGNATADGVAGASLTHNLNGSSTGCSGPCTVQTNLGSFDSNGAATATFTAYRAESGRTLTVTATNSATGSTAPFTVIPDAPATLSLSAASTTPTAGDADNLTITALDVYGNIAAPDISAGYAGYADGSHNLTFGGAHDAPAGNHPTVSNRTGTAVTFGSTTAIDFSGGVATVTGSSNGLMKLYKAESTNITVTDGTFSNGAGLGVVVAPAVVNHFTLGAPSPSAIAGHQSSVSVAAFDVYGNATANGVSGAVLSSTLHGSSIGCSGPCTVQTNLGAFDSNGTTTATFTAYKAETGRTLTVTATNSAAGSTAPFTVVPDTPTTLAYTQQPVETQVALVITPAVKVLAKDAYDNLAYNTSVKIAIATDPSGSATLGGTTTRATDANGVATFNDLTINKVGIGYVLRATAPPVSPTASQLSLAFIVAQTVTTCSGTCSGTATVPNNSTVTTNVNSAGTNNTLGIALVGATRPNGVCAGFNTDASIPASRVDVNIFNTGGATPTLNITWTLAKAEVNKISNNGAAHYDLCLGGVKLTDTNHTPPPPIDTTTGYPIKSPALCPTTGTTLSTACPVFDTTFNAWVFWGILPDCSKKLPSGPCVVSKTKDPAGNLIFKYQVPYPWDPTSHLGGT
jgi:hypothetical protein